MTEEEAKTKYCPLLIAGFYAGAAGKESANTNCATSNCMMWETDYRIYIQDGEDRCESDGGHCGLAK